MMRLERTYSVTRVITENQIIGGGISIISKYLFDMQQQLAKDAGPVYRHLSIKQVFSTDMDYSDPDRWRPVLKIRLEAEHWV